MPQPNCIKERKHRRRYIKREKLRRKREKKQEEAMELVGAVADKGDIISLADAGDVNRTEVDAEVDARFEVLQAVVRSMRNARAEYQVAPGKRIPATVVATDAGALADLQAERAALCFLAKLDEGFELAAEAPTDVADDAVRLVVRDGVSVVLPMSGLVDVEKETERLTKQAAKLDKSLGQLEARLSSDFVNKAPAKVVDAAKAEAEEFRAQREQITARLAELAAMAPASS